MVASGQTLVNGVLFLKRSCRPTLYHTAIQSPFAGACPKAVAEFDRSQLPGEFWQRDFVFMAKKCTRCQQVKDKFPKRAALKDGLSSWCSDCMSDYNKLRRTGDEYRVRERVYQRQLKRKYRQREEFRDKEKQQSAKRYANGLKQIREGDPEKWRGFLDRQNGNRRGKAIVVAQARVYRNNRLAQKRLAGGTFTHKEWVELCQSYGNICLACRHPKPLTIDHVIPLSKGGSNDISNVQPLCGSCNSSKGDKTIDYR